MRAWECLATLRYLSGINVLPQFVHSCAGARHSMTLRLMPEGVNTRSRTRLTLGWPVTFFPFDHRIISVPPHLGHLLLVISMRRLTRSRWFSYPLARFFFFFSTLLVRTNTRCL